MKNGRLSSKPSKGSIFIDPERRPWPHEMRTARTLALAGYDVHFMPESNLASADILLNGVKFEIKAPKTNKTSSLEQAIRKALKQSSNVIIDSFRMQLRDDVTRNFLIKKCREQKQIKRMLFINKKSQIIDIFSLI